MVTWDIISLQRKKIQLKMDRMNKMVILFICNIFFQVRRSVWQVTKNDKLTTASGHSGQPALHSKYIIESLRFPRSSVAQGVWMFQLQMNISFDYCRPRHLKRFVICLVRNKFQKNK